MPEPRLDPTLARVKALYQSGRWGEARDACRSVLAREPHNAHAHAAAGMLSLKLGDVGAAEAHYRAAVQHDASFAEAHFNWGNVLAQLGRAEEAALALSTAAQLRPDFVSAHNNLGGVLLELGRHADAEQSYRRALTLAPRAAHLHRNLGTSLRAQGELAPALDAFRRAVALEPRWPKALQSLATTAMEVGDWALSRAACTRWLELAPGNAEALGLCSIALDELGEAEADELLDIRRLFTTVQLVEAPGGGPLEDFNRALARQALEEPSLAVPATTDGRYHCPTLLISGDIASDPRSAGATLSAWVAEQVGAYLRALGRAAPTHPFTRGAPPRWELQSWFAVLKGEGQLEPHVHYESYVSAVYYAQVPESMRGGVQAGYFELSGGPSQFPCRRLREPHAVQPREGLLLLFPSYFYHRTLPFHADTPRISVAFDAAPLASFAQ